MKLFLGGTCNNSKWREELMPLLDGVNIQYFNPVVDDWNEEAQENERHQKDQECSNHLYVITPEMTGVFSIAEIMESTLQNKNKTYVCILHDYGDKSFDEGQWRSLLAVLKMADDYGASTHKTLKGLLEAVDFDCHNLLKPFDKPDIHDSSCAKW